MPKLRVTVEGKIYDVEVELLDESGKPVVSAPVAGTSAPVSAASLGGVTPVPKKSAPAAVDGAVASPLAGKVVSIDVAQGASVNSGDQLMTLEAMKMNTHVYAPQDGTVVDIMVQPGDTVEEGQAMIKLK